jgi:NAD(P)-dependent dehydrogenase (short-subunit alcohol dehydrogenase family)
MAAAGFDTFVEVGAGDTLAKLIGAFFRRRRRFRRTTMKKRKRLRSGFMLSGKIAVVTGGSRGIGRAICEEFAENGAAVAFLYAGNSEKAAEFAAELQKNGTRARAYRCDVAELAEVTETFQKIVAEFGTIDILVNNAGITRDKLVLSMRESDFDDVIGVNLRAHSTPLNRYIRSS